MSNPSKLPFQLELSGDSGPVEQMWEAFLRDHTDESFSENQRQNARVIFYIAAARMYDTLVTMVKLDPTMGLMVRVTELIHKDIDAFFKDSSKVELVKTH